LSNLPESPSARTGATESGTEPKVSNGSVVEQLRESIISGEYAAGERLVEMTVAAQLGSSRGKIRQALRQLEHEGLVITTPNRGATAVGVSDEEVLEVLMPIRLIIERYSFCRARSTFTADDFAELGKQVWIIEDAAQRNDLRTAVEADLRFHEIVLERAGGLHTLQVWRSILPRIRIYFVRYGEHRDINEIATEHRQLLDALRGDDLDRLLSVLEEHITVPLPVVPGPKRVDDLA
jgi:DNA-binding GntR family transcriptional regulator